MLRTTTALLLHVRIADKKAMMIPAPILDGACSSYPVLCAFAWRGGGAASKLTRTARTRTNCLQMSSAPCPWITKAVCPSLGLGFLTPSMQRNRHFSVSPQYRYEHGARRPAVWLTRHLLSVEDAASCVVSSTIPSSVSASPRALRASAVAF